MSPTNENCRALGVDIIAVIGPIREIENVGQQLPSNGITKPDTFQLIVVLTPPICS